jgi:hypothetical protein
MLPLRSPFAVPPADPSLAPPLFWISPVRALFPASKGVPAGAPPSVGAIYWDIMAPSFAESPDPVPAMPTASTERIAADKIAHTVHKVTNLFIQTTSCELLHSSPDRSGIFTGNGNSIQIYFHWGTLWKPRDLQKMTIPLSAPTAETRCRR